MEGAALVGVAVPVGASSRGLNRPRLLRPIGAEAVSMRYSRSTRAHMCANSLSYTRLVRF